MPKEWSQVKRYSKTGWENCSFRIFLGILTFFIVISYLGSRSFWITFSSLSPILLLYYPLLGFLIETLERDWEDWHLW